MNPECQHDLAAERAALRDYADAQGFLEDNPDLLSKGLLAGLYGAEELQFELARRVPLLPGRVE